MPEPLLLRKMRMCRLEPSFRLSRARAPEVCSAIRIHHMPDRMIFDHTIIRSYSSIGRTVPATLLEAKLPPAAVTVIDLTRPGYWPRCRLGCR